MLRGDMGDGPGVLDLVGGAAPAGELCAKPRVLLIQQAAHGISLVGGAGAADECARLLDEAAGLLDMVDDEYPWGGNCRTPCYVDVQRATIAGRLGRAREALDMWHMVIPGIPVSSRRDLGVYRARQAQAFAAAGEPDQAAEVASEVAPIAVETGSARMRAELGVLRTLMKPWRGEQADRVLEEALAVAARK
jgi:hypothetical protein